MTLPSHFSSGKPAAGLVKSNGLVPDGESHTISTTIGGLDSTLRVAHLTWQTVPTPKPTHPIRPDAATADQSGTRRPVRAARDDRSDFRLKMHASSS